MIAAMLFTPSYYHDDPHSGGRPLLQMYHRLLPFEQTIDQPNVVFFTTGGRLWFALENYLLRQQRHELDLNGLVNTLRNNQHLEVDFNNAIANGSTDANLFQILDHAGVNMLDIDPDYYNQIEQHPGGFDEFIDTARILTAGA